MLDVFSVHKKLLEAASPSGFETPVTDVIANMAKLFCDEMRVDPLGNLICRKKGKGKRILLSAHTDVVGFMVNHIDENGFLSVCRVGYPKIYTVINSRLVFKNGTAGILRVRKAADATAKKPEALISDDLYIDIGAKDAAEAASLVSVGDTCIFEGEPVKLANDRVMTPYADDLIGCAVLLCTMEQAKLAPSDVYYVFTVQEEVGCRGARAAAARLDADIALSCDVCIADDTPDVHPMNSSICLGKGPCLTVMDSEVITSKGLNALLVKVADALSLKMQREVSALSGGSDSSELLLANGGTATSAVNVPLRNLHSPVETYDLNDVRDTVRLLTAFVRAKL